MTSSICNYHNLIMFTENVNCSERFSKELVVIDVSWCFWRGEKVKSGWLLVMTELCHATYKLLRSSMWNLTICGILSKYLLLVMHRGYRTFAACFWKCITAWNTVFIIGFLRSNTKWCTKQIVLGPSLG